MEALTGVGLKIFVRYLMRHVFILNFVSFVDYTVVAVTGLCSRHMGVNTVKYCRGETGIY